MLGILCRCNFGPTAETVAVDFVEMTPADDKPICVWRLELGQTTELGDAQEEFIETTLVRGNTSSGSGGVAAATPTTVGPSTQTPGMTFEALNTTPASSGTTKNLAHPIWSVRGGMDRVFLPEERDTFSQGNTVCCWRAGAAPADSITMGGSVLVEEVG